VSGFPAPEAARQAQAAEFRERERNSLFSIWQAAAPGEASPVEAYLKKRGLEFPAGAHLRYAAQQAFFDGETVGEDGRKYRRIVHRGPAMIAAIQGADGKFRGLHFTYIDLKEPKGKARIADPDTGLLLVPKKSRGTKSGGRVELVRPEGFSRLVVGEGIETVLAAWFAERDPRTAYWSAVDLGNIGGRSATTVLHPTVKDSAGRRRRVPGPDPGEASDHPPLDVPDQVDEVIILGDGDSDRFNTENALRRASKRWARPGRVVRVAWAPEGKDFNDLPLGEARELLRQARPFDTPLPDQVEQLAADFDKIVSLDRQAVGERRAKKSKKKKDDAAPVEPRALGYDDGCTCVAAPRSGGSHTRLIIHVAQKSSHAFTHIVKR
jgi:hypothetical protein